MVEPTRLPADLASAARRDGEEEGELGPMFSLIFLMRSCEGLDERLIVSWFLLFAGDRWLLV